MAAIAIAIPIVAIIVKWMFKIATAMWYYGTGQAIAGMVKGEFKDPKEAAEANDNPAGKIEDAIEKEDDAKKEEK